MLRHIHKYTHIYIHIYIYTYTYLLLLSNKHAQYTYIHDYIYILYIHIHIYITIYVYTHGLNQEIPFTSGISQRQQEKSTLTAKLVAAMDRCGDLEERCEVLVAKKILGRPRNVLGKSGESGGKTMENAMENGKTMENPMENGKTPWKML